MCENLERFWNSWTHMAFFSEVYFNSNFLKHLMEAWVTKKTYTNLLLLSTTQ